VLSVSAPASHTGGLSFSWEVREMSDTRYLAIAFSSRIANGHLRTAVTAAAPPDAKVVRTRSDVVAAVFEVEEDVDARSEGERLRRLGSEARRHRRAPRAPAGRAGGLARADERRQSEDDTFRRPRVVSLRPRS